MGNIGPLEILIILLILGISVAIVAALILLSRRRQGAHTNSIREDAVTTSELRTILSETISDQLTAVEAKLSDMEERLAVLEQATPHEQRQIGRGKAPRDVETSLDKQEQERSGR